MAYKKGQPISQNKKKLFLRQKWIITLHIVCKYNKLMHLHVCYIKKTHILNSSMLLLLLLFVLNILFIFIMKICLFIRRVLFYFSLFFTSKLFFLPFAILYYNIFVSFIHFLWVFSWNSSAYIKNLLRLYCCTFYLFFFFISLQFSDI